MMLPSSSVVLLIAAEAASTAVVGLPFGIPDRLLFLGRMILDDEEDDEIVRVVPSSCAAAIADTDDSDPGVVSSIGRELVLLLLLLAVVTVSVDEDGAQNATSSPLCTNDLCATFQLSDRLFFLPSLVLSEIFGTSGKRISFGCSRGGRSSSLFVLFGSTSGGAESVIVGSFRCVFLIVVLDVECGMYIFISAYVLVLYVRIQDLDRKRYCSK